MSEEREIKDDSKPVRRAPPPPVEQRWKPGQSGNPGGRPKGLPAKIGALTRDGQDIINKFHEIAFGNGRGWTSRDRVDALKWLSDRKWGKAPELQLHAELDGETAAAAMALSTSELQALAASLASDDPASLPPGDMTIDAVPSDVEAFSPSPGDASPSDDES
jgi:hypothetical protein